jgi:cytochrome c oxidase accessory protein FixG
MTDGVARTASTHAASERVLSTLNQDGTRVRLRPRPSPGRFYNRRRVVAYALIALFVALPYVSINGKPALLLDLISREFTFFGTTFRPTDTLILMIVGLAIVLAIFLITALFGRVWCGWGCPQTVYLEWVFRPIERLWEGRGTTTAWRRVGKHLTFLALAALLSNVFLAYFVGADRLATWVFHSPAAHPVGFAVVVIVTGLMFFDFAWFREQTCIIACPYGRLQTVLVDRQSLIIGYDATRGEPRGKVGKASGDCIDCRACVTTCPTGIDIRQGLQMECIGCAQCIDACDAIMTRVKRPPGLIRYTSQDQLAGKPSRLLRGRTIVYPVLLAIVVVALALSLGGRAAAEVSILRTDGAPFSILPTGEVSTPLTVKVENRTGVRHDYRVELLGAEDARVINPQPTFALEPGHATTVPLFVIAPWASFRAGRRVVEVRVRDEAGFDRTLSTTLLGPEPAPKAGP